MEVLVFWSQAGICQSFNEWTFGDLESTSVFVDDFHTSNETFEDHVEAVKALLERGRQHGVEWRLSKCHWCQPKVVLVGFEISAEGRRPDPSKVEALKNWPKEQELADLNSMFHFANYLREFIPGFIDIVPPLKGVPEERG